MRIFYGFREEVKCGVMAQKEKRFVHVGVQSEWTPGAVGVAEEYALLAAAKRMGVVGVADEESIAGYGQWQAACDKRGVRPVYGMRSGGVDLVVEKPEGFDSVARLVEAAREKRLGMEELEANKEGLVAVAAAEDYEEVREVYGAGQALLGLENYGDEASRRKMRENLDAAQRWEAEVIARNRVWRGMRLSEDRVVSAVRVARSTKTVLPRRMLVDEELWVDKRRFPPGGWLRPAGEMRELFAEAEEAAEATVGLVERVEVKRLPEVKLPAYPVREGETAVGVLRRLVEEKVVASYGEKVSQELKQRLEEELGVIEKTGRSESFLLAREIVELAKKRGVAMFGMGSATGSQVCFELGITDVEPLANGLSFERFLTEATKTHPDIDWQVDARKREEFLNEIAGRSGELGLYLSRIVTRPTYGVRGAMRETMRAWGVKDEEIRRVLGMLWGRKKVERRYQPMIMVALELARRGMVRGNLPRHASKVVVGGEERPAGVVMRKGEGGERIVEIDRNEAEKWVNFDLVSSQALALVMSVAEVVGEEPEGFKYEPGLIRKAFENPIGIPYLESEWMRKVLGNYATAAEGELTEEDLLAAISLSRPGVAQSLGEYLYKLRRWGRGKRGGEILGQTLGLVLYQDQVLEVAREVAGMAAAEAEELRRAISKERGGEKMRRAIRGFVKGATEKGMEREEAQRLAQMLENFSRYGFLKGHAGELVKRVCLPAGRLKYEYPDEYFGEVRKRRTNYYFYIGQGEIYEREWRRVKRGKLGAGL